MWAKTNFPSKVFRFLGTELSGKHTTIDLIRKIVRNTQTCLKSKFFLLFLKLNNIHKVLASFPIIKGNRWKYGMSL